MAEEVAVEASTEKSEPGSPAKKARKEVPGNFSYLPEDEVVRLKLAIRDWFALAE